MRSRRWIAGLSIAAVAVAGSLDVSRASGEERPDEVLDGDGHLDFAFGNDNLGIPTYGGLTVYSTKERRFVAAPWSYRTPVRVLRRRSGEPPVLVSRESHHHNRGGTAMRDVGACAMRHELRHWTGAEFEWIASAWIAQGG